MVHVGTGSIHWVQANGYCVNVSWNIGYASSSQIAAAAIENDNVQQERLMQHVPLMASLVSIANKQKFVENKEVVEVIRSMFIRKSLFHTRSEYYTYSWSVDDLAKILDNYHYRPDATADFEPTIPPPGEADEPGTSD